MPIYEFECLTCKKRFERLQKMADPDPDVCIHCGAGPIRRCVTAPAFRLVGSGWYETDFKKEGRRNLAGGDREEQAAAPTAKAESKSKSKAEPPTTSASDTGS